MVRVVNSYTSPSFGTVSNGSIFFSITPMRGEQNERLPLLTPIPRACAHNKNNSDIALGKTPLSYSPQVRSARLEERQIASEMLILAALRNQQPPKPKPIKREGWVGDYSREERAALIRRFLAKRQRRIWAKKVRYDIRKDLATTRARVKGRFVSAKQ